jgi:hypothetical protein
MIRNHHRFQHLSPKRILTKNLLDQFPRLVKVRMIVNIILVTINQSLIRCPIDVIIVVHPPNLHRIVEVQ